MTKPSALDADLDAARRAFAPFAEVVMTDESTGLPAILAPHHRATLDHIDYAWSHGQHAFIVCPPGHGKTSLTEAIALYLLGTYPTIRIKVVCASEPIAIERTGKIRTLIETSGRYRAIFPSVKLGEPWRPSRLYLARGGVVVRDPSLHACGVTTSAMGSRADVLIFDDVDDERCVVSPQRRTLVRRSVQEKFLSRLEPGGRVIAIATRWHEEDLFGTILADPALRARWALLEARIDVDRCEFIELTQWLPSERTHVLRLGWKSALLDVDADDGHAMDADVQNRKHETDDDDEDASEPVRRGPRMSILA